MATNRAEYRKSGEGASSWATREIAALDFLVHIPLEAERGIVLSGLEAERNLMDAMAIGKKRGKGRNKGKGKSSIKKYDRHGHNRDQRQQGHGGEQITLDENSHSYSLDKSLEERLDTDTSIEGFATIAAAASNTSITTPVIEVSTSSKNGGWWHAMIPGVEEERMKQKQLLELETGVLERPDDNNGTVGIVSPFPIPGAAAGAIPVPVPGLEGEDGTGDGKNMNAGTGTTMSRPTSAATIGGGRKNDTTKSSTATANTANFIPGRRLDGHEATRVHIPREAAETELKTRHRTVARKAAEKEWELKMTRNGAASNGNSGSLLDGRIFFSNTSSYPVGVFSVIKFDPKNEEMIRRRQKLEALGGGGTKFVLPSRDWRGISFRKLLPRKERKNKTFNEMLKRSRERARRKYERSRRREMAMEQKGAGGDNIDGDGGYSGDYDISSVSSDDDGDNQSMHSKDIEHDLKDSSDNASTFEHDESSVSSSSSDESETYQPGFLDDPAIKKGKHRTAMVGDKVRGCVSSSIIHYVRPADLKADLNKQFRQRFDQWEPPKSRRKYIGARVVDGTYKLIDPTENKIDDEADDRGSYSEESSLNSRRRKGSISKPSTTEKGADNIRMPPSLTLSKIRNLKQSALLACIKAKLEVSTVALACVYFERLALDCRVDKTNRRLTFAACLLIAIKVNEANVKIVHEQPKKNVLKSWIKAKKDNDFFEPLFVFFTHDWELSLKTVFAAEWGVFAALEFKLHASPSEVSFHFKRLMKALEWSPRDYLGKEMYDYWREALTEESLREKERAARRAQKRKHREKKILKLQRQLQQNEANQRRRASTPDYTEVTKDAVAMQSETTSPKGKFKAKGILSRIGLKRSANDLQTIQSIQTSMAEAEKSKDGEETKEVIGLNSFHRSISSPNFLTTSERTTISNSLH